MQTNMKLKQSSERKMEWYETEISFSEADKERALKDLSGYMKELLEKQGHQVKRVLVTTEFERKVKAAVTRGGSRPIGSPEVMPALLAHIVFPATEKSLWI